mmetsp:Transcript_8011/g.12155  ORF Transcript_8011/g.12155 Transcript_8011/m.12155 type:complete len:108 (-) Transcript_8011:396-719(-)
MGLLHLVSILGKITSQGQKDRIEATHYGEQADREQEIKDAERKSKKMRHDRDGFYGSTSQLEDLGSASAADFIKIGMKEVTYVEAGDVLFAMKLANGQLQILCQLNA